MAYGRASLLRTCPSYMHVTSLPACALKYPATCASAAPHQRNTLDLTVRSLRSSCVARTRDRKGSKACHNSGPLVLHDFRLTVWARLADDVSEVAFRCQLLMAETLLRRELFGGAILLAVPERFTDISDFRPVPDNQEILADGGSDQSLIVEVMEHSSRAAEDHPAARFYFQDIATLADAENVRIHSASSIEHSGAPKLPDGVSISVATGQQTIAKGSSSSQAANDVLVTVGVIQLPQVRTDLVLTLNLPLRADNTTPPAAHIGADNQVSHEAAAQLFSEILRTLEIVDWKLFATD